MAKAFDVIIFGPSGFTGQFVVEEMARNGSKKNVSWAVAGRNRHKIQQTLEKAGNILSDNLMETEIFEADVTDQISLDNMCKNAKLVINCVGPYEKYGEPVVMACLKHRTHLIDMTIEVTYIYRMILRYYREAESQGVYIVSACGIGYLPVEVMISNLQQRFAGGVSSIDCYVKCPIKRKSVHFATWESMTIMSNSIYEMLAARQKLSSQIMNRNQSKWRIISPSWPFKVSTEFKELGMLVPSILHTAQLSLVMQEHQGHRKPIDMKTYVVISSWLVLFKVIIFALFIMLLVPFSFGKRLLLKYPELFSGGVVWKSDVPAKKDVVKADLMAVAKGWSKKQQANGKPIGKPDKTVTVRVSGPPCYKATAICLVQSAITVLNETTHLPKGGGIYTPLAAFSETSLLSRLCDNQFVYEIYEN